MLSSVQVLDQWKTSGGTGSPAWTGLVFTQVGFAVSFIGATFPYSMDDPYLMYIDESQEAMDLVKSGKIDMAPVAITPEGVLVVLPPEKSLATIICSIIDLNNVNTGNKNKVLMS